MSFIQGDNGSPLSHDLAYLFILLLISFALFRAIVRNRAKMPRQGTNLLLLVVFVRVFVSVCFFGQHGVSFCLVLVILMDASCLVRCGEKLKG